ncbi:MAG: hypothetical protein NZ529_05295 [Cytophagaceae bacterium]|nr:hypothetical protein [Cytophagaceae bacterium]MDW8456192.1 hypothetical protein [Cytophagaceae bacterium]
MKKLSVFFSIIALITSCATDNQSNEALIADTSATSSSEAMAQLPEEAIGEIIRQIPAPIETAYFIKKSGSDYSKEILNPADNSKKYSTSYKKALNLGVYGADLGYINIYEKNKEGLYYLNSIKEMADGLNIGQFFDFETIKRLATNNQNIDSLLNITTENFNKINSFLYEQKRAEQSVLILTGGWIEGLHIMCQVALKNKNQKLYEKIGEQKIVVNKLASAISNFEGLSAELKSLSNQLKELQKIYEKVEISVEYKGSTTEIVDGIPTIVDKTESKVLITEDQVKEISNTTKSLRDKIVS